MVQADHKQVVDYVKQKKGLLLPVVLTVSKCFHKYALHHIFCKNVCGYSKLVLKS